MKDFFNQSIHDAVKHGGDYWRNYQKLHKNDRVSCDRTFDNHEIINAWLKAGVRYAGLPVAKRYANWS
jgi:hypothetical protein